MNNTTTEPTLSKVATPDHAVAEAFQRAAKGNDSPVALSAGAETLVLYPMPPHPNGLGRASVIYTDCRHYTETSLRYAIDEDIRRLCAAADRGDL